MRTLLKAPGKPLHPPLTDASIGAYTAGVAMLVMGALGVEEEQAEDTRPREALNPFGPRRP